jgi:hypothetical protein
MKQEGGVEEEQLTADWFFLVMKSGTFLSSG